MLNHHHTDLSQVAVYGLFYNASGADDLNLYVWFEIEGEHVSTSTVKGNPGSSVEWPTENLRFTHQHSTASNLQVKLYHKRTMMPDSTVAEGSLPWEAVVSQKVCEVRVGGSSGHSATVRFAVGKPNSSSTGQAPGMMAGTAAQTAGTGTQGTQGMQSGGQQSSQYAGYPNIQPAPDSYQGGPKQGSAAGTQFPPAPAYAGGNTSSQPAPYTSQLPHQGGGSQPPAYAGQSSGQTGYPGQGTGGYSQAGQVTGQSTDYGTGAGAVGSSTAAGGKQGYADKAKGFLHKNLDSLDKRIDQWNKPRDTQGTQAVPQGGTGNMGRVGGTDPMVNAMGAAPAGSVAGSAQQGSQPGQPRFSDWTKDAGTWGLNKIQQGVKGAKGVTASKPGATGTGTGTGSSTTGQGYTGSRT